MRIKVRLWYVSTLLLTAATLVASRPTAASSGLVTNVQAERHGLVRAWFSQAELDRNRHRVQHAVLADDQLFVLTTAGVVQAMDAKTGSTDWVTRIGNPNYPSLGPAASPMYVALVNGSTVTVLDRETGNMKISHELSGGAGGGPALTDEYVFVPMFTGKMDAYSLDGERGAAWFYASTGYVFDAPVATVESVIWPTDRGYLYVANANATGVRYRFESSGQINGGPAVANGVIYASSSNGYLYAISEPSGKQRWRYSTGSAIDRSPVVVSDRIYVATERPSLHCVSTTGSALWESPDVVQFAGASKSRVYGLDRMGDLLIIDSNSGVQLGQVRTTSTTHAIINSQTDRIYLISDTGLVQCLHEIGADEPTMHVQLAPPKQEASDGREQPTREQQPPSDDKPVERDVPNPFSGPEDSTNPFGAPSGNPFGGDEEAEPANPFDSDENDGGNPFDF